MQALYRSVDIPKVEEAGFFLNLNSYTDTMGDFKDK